MDALFGGKIILITGGTGSFGRAFIKELLNYNPRKAIVLSRDEYKQFLMAQEYTHDSMRFLLGDVRDLSRLQLAFRNVDYVIHAAALKQVPALEYNPIEAIKTNIDGAANVIRAAVDNKVKKVVGLSTDKAVNPVNLYGATKLAAEKLLVAANAYTPTAFSCVRYGNVIGSRGSVIPLFQKLIGQGKKKLPITDTRMTRFWITMGGAVELVKQTLNAMTGGEIYVPRLPSMKLVDLADALCPNCEIEEVGIRPGEKIHECLVSEDNRNVFFVDGDRIYPATPGFTSDTNDKWLKKEELCRFLAS